ncbi:hypothetical protein NQZ68_021787 [Dissostichus eleginoides]|nr:hypothetical protein NQZ68_021787 [Dissostichus eleginoides]
MHIPNQVSLCPSLAIILKDDYFVRGAGLPGRFKAEKVEFHWGPNNGSEGSEHSINGHRYPVEPKVSREVLRLGLVPPGSPRTRSKIS